MPRRQEGDLPLRVTPSLDHLTSQHSRSPISTMTIPKTIEVTTSASIIGACVRILHNFSKKEALREPQGQLRILKRS